MLLDCHAHLDQYDAPDLEKALQDIAGRRILTLAVSMDAVSFERSAAIAALSPLVVPAFGVHPWKAHAAGGDVNALADPTARAPLLGEVGLDYHFVKERSRFPGQRKVFEFFLREAVSQDKTLNVHTKGAEADVLAMIRDHRPPRVIVHWYSGPMDVLEGFIEAGAYFTVGVEIGHSEEIRRLVQAMPRDRLLTETDGPGATRWLTGKTGMPSDLESVLDHLARLWSTDREGVSSAVRGNFLRLADNDPHLGRHDAFMEWREKDARIREENE